MTQTGETERVMGLFRKTGALLEGHFLLSSGLHSEKYLQCALVLARPGLAEDLGERLAKLQKEKPDLVLSPAMGGLIIGHEVARALGVRAYFTERENGAMSLRRGFSLEPGEKVVVVEDVVTTGKSSREVIDLAQARGAKVLSVLSIVNRSPAASSLGFKLKSLVDLAIPTYRPEDCPLCRQGVPYVKPGSRTAPK